VPCLGRHWRNLLKKHEHDPGELAKHVAVWVEPGSDVACGNIFTYRLCPRVSHRPGSERACTELMLGTPSLEWMASHINCKLSDKECLHCLQSSKQVKLQFDGCLVRNVNIGLLEFQFYLICAPKPVEIPYTGPRSYH
jgi:hypothetical protein